VGNLGYYIAAIKVTPGLFIILEYKLFGNWPLGRTR
jgi:hypothetical protein